MDITIHNLPVNAKAGCGLKSHYVVGNCAVVLIYGETLRDTHIRLNLDDIDIFHHVINQLADNDNQIYNITNDVALLKLATEEFDGAIMIIKSLGGKSYLITKKVFNDILKEMGLDKEKEEEEVDEERLVRSSDGIIFHPCKEKRLNGSPLSIQIPVRIMGGIISFLMCPYCMNETYLLLHDDLRIRIYSDEPENVYITLYPITKQPLEIIIKKSTITNFWRGDHVLYFYFNGDPDAMIMNTWFSSAPKAHYHERDDVFRVESIAVSDKYIVLNSYPADDDGFEMSTDDNLWLNYSEMLDVESFIVTHVAPWTRRYVTHEMDIKTVMLEDENRLSVRITVPAKGVENDSIYYIPYDMLRDYIYSDEYQLYKVRMTNVHEFYKP